MQFRILYVLFTKKNLVVTQSPFYLLKAKSIPEANASDRGINDIQLVGIY